MCLGIPMCIEQIEGTTARCSARGVERTVSLFLLQGQRLAPGDYVMIHVGYAIQKVSAAEARSRWELYDAYLAPDSDA